MSDHLLPMFGNPATPWRDWFAWHPVKTADAGWQWFRRVQYRLIVGHSYLPRGGSTWFQYRLLVPLA